ncbi:MAG: hypothetical protein HYZ18_10415 [Pseudogulbenkiania sp.]|nr:hypothetical protein [Pseudogulbenkiania sp.]
MFTARWKMSQVALAATLAMAPLLAQADITTTLPDYPLEVCTTSIDPTQSGSAAAVTNSNIVQGDNTLFASYYNYSEMTGDLKAFTIDTSTGSVDSTAQWSAQSKLDAISNLSTGRKLYTNISAGLIELESGNGSNDYCGDAIRRLYLNAITQSACQDIIKTLKGDTTITGYRHPAHRLGTIVHSEPIYVSGLQRVIQAANDGMVHAFKHDNSAIGTNNSSNGEEAWAYVPKAFLNSIGQSDAPKIDTFTSILYLTHKYWLDATPSVENFGSTTYYFASAYGKGAKGVFSLTLAAAQPTPLWTFDTTIAATSTDTSTDSDTYVGYVYGRPIITQVTIGTTLTKVAIFAGGFSNTDLGNSSITGNVSNYSYLYVVNLSTGALIKKFKVTGKGLNYIAGFADSYSALNQVKYVYGGDLDGNVWRFDLTATTASSWAVHKLASLSAPITSEPELAEITIDGTAKRFVYVGTGRYLTSSDIGSGETGSMYGLIDRIDTVTDYDDGDDATTPSQLSTVTLASSSYATEADPNTGTAGNISTHGWKAQLPSGQRVINSPALANGKVLFTANQPADPCTSGMESWLYIIDYQTGLQTGYFSLASIASSANISDTHFLSSRPTVIKLSSGDYKAMLRTTDGETLKVDVGTLLSTSTGGSGTVKGVFWREVITE